MISRRLMLGLGVFAGVGVSHVGAQGHNLITYPKMRSAFVGPRTVHVWLPPDYGQSSRRYRVIYLQDGQNAFSPVYAFRNQPLGIDAVLSARAEEGAVKNNSGGAIVVAIWNTANRRAEYAPTAIEAYVPQTIRDRIERENGGPSSGDAYLNFIVHELKPFIDATYKTRPDAASNSLMGASRGGMISLYGLCQHPDIFGAAACLSTHWLMVSAPTPESSSNLEYRSIIEAICTYLKDTLPKPDKHRIWMDHGTINLDSYYGPYQLRVDHVFDTHNWQKGRHYESRVYASADHNEAAWRARLGDPLDFILRC